MGLVDLAKACQDRPGQPQPQPRAKWRLCAEIRLSRTGSFGASRIMESAFQTQRSQRKGVNSVGGSGFYWSGFAVGCLYLEESCPPVWPGHGTDKLSSIQLVSNGGHTE